MGLILDSSVLVAAERQGQNARQMLASVAQRISETEIGIRVITLIELAHGAARANTPERKAKRQKFIEELQTAMPIHPVTVPLGNLGQTERFLHGKRLQPDRHKLFLCARFHPRRLRMRFPVWL